MVNTRRSSSSKKDVQEPLSSIQKSISAGHKFTFQRRVFTNKRRLKTLKFIATAKHNPAKFGLYGSTRWFESLVTYLEEPGIILVENARCWIRQHNDVFVNAQYRDKEGTSSASPATSASSPESKAVSASSTEAATSSPESKAALESSTEMFASSPAPKADSPSSTEASGSSPASKVALTPSTDEVSSSMEITPVSPSVASCGDQDSSTMSRSPVSQTTVTSSSSPESLLPELRNIDIDAVFSSIGRTPPPQQSRSNFSSKVQNNDQLQAPPIAEYTYVKLIDDDDHLFPPLRERANPENNHPVFRLSTNEEKPDLMNVVLGELDTYFHRLPTDYVVRMVQPSSNPEVITID